MNRGQQHPDGAPSPEDLIRYVADQLGDAARATIESHLDTCGACRLAVSDLAAITQGGGEAARTAPPAGSPRQRAPGDEIGRYVILHLLGQGAMGVVYAAYDPELDRKVALKLVLDPDADEASHARLLREARALARLAHPNVVAIHDVGSHGGEVFIALEYVAGTTLRTWLSEAPRSWPEVREVFLAAGRGLAAAHAAGLVHRDVKPQNVLIGRDGRVRVSDLGIARAITAPSATADLAATGAGSGTPAYMSPEQLRGDVVDARSDQFSFCVSLYEAAFGVRPFAGDDLATLRRRVLGGEMLPPPTTTAVPRQVRDTILRGLRVAPADRHPSMTALLGALGPPPARTRRRWLIAAGVAGLLGLGALAMPRASGDPCGGGAGRLAGAWDASVRTAVRQALIASDRPGAAAAFGRVERALDGYARDWVDMHRSTCRATRVDGEQSDQLLDLRMRCLDQRHGALAALTDVLAHDPDVTLDGAITAANTLPALAGCADRDNLAAAVPLPDDPAARAAVIDLASTLERAEALQRVGRFAEAAALAAPLVERARAAGHAPTVARTLYVVGDLTFRTGDAETAERLLGEAAQAAALGHDDVRAAQAWTLLVALVGYIRGEHERGATLAEFAEVAVVRAGNGDDLRAELEDSVGLVLDAAGRWADARTHYQRALELRERVHGKASLEAALSLNNLAAAPYEMGDYVEAAALWQRALDIRLDILGPDSPDVAATMSNLASARRHQERSAEARALFERALAIWQASLGPDHPDVAAAHNNLGDLLREARELPAATTHLERARAIWQASLGPDHPSSISATTNLGLVAYAAGDFPRALELLDDALARTERVAGADHPEVAMALVNTGEALEQLGRFADALGRYRRAIAVLDRGATPDDRRRAFALTGIGSALVGLDRPREAIAPLTRAVALREAGENPVTLATSRFALATALVDTGEPARAVALARDAHPVFAAAGEPAAARVAAWLERHDPRRASP